MPPSASLEDRLAFGTSIGKVSSGWLAGGSKIIRYTAPWEVLLVIIISCCCCAIGLHTGPEENIHVEMEESDACAIDQIGGCSFQPRSHHDSVLYLEPYDRVRCT